MRHASPDVSIIIVNWNTRDLLLQCLQSLPAAIGDLDADVWVVDNASTDDSVAAVRQHFPTVQVIENKENVGFAAANNQAIKASHGRHVVLLNSDTVAHPNALRAMVRLLDNHRHVGIVGAQLLNADGSLQHSWAAFPTVWSEVLGKNIRTRRIVPTGYDSFAFDVDWISGACLMIRRSVIEQVGMLDERFFMYSEETDWCYRVKRAGWHVYYYPQAHVVHFGGQSSRQASTRMKAELYRSKLLFFSKHYGVRRTFCLSLLLEIGFVGKAMLEWCRYHASTHLYTTNQFPSIWEYNDPCQHDPQRTSKDRTYT